MTQEKIIAAIEAKIGDTDHRIWRIGITDDPERTRHYWSDTERKKTFFWTHWQADSLNGAHQIKSHFVTAKGVKEGMEGNQREESGPYVYLF
jgi:hypothetical protein